MKKSIIRLASALLICAVMLGLCACGKIVTPPECDETIESTPDVSFDNIICQYSSGDIVWDDDIRYFYEDFSTNITFYADGTVRLWTSMDHYYDTDVIFESTAQITEEQKTALIEAISQSSLLTFSSCGTYDVLERDYGRDSRWGYIIFYDAEGSEVHTCGGLQPDNTDYNAVVAVIREIFPYTHPTLAGLRNQTMPVAQVRRFTNNICIEEKEHGISCDEYAFSLYYGYENYPYDGLEYDIYFERYYSIVSNGDLEIKVTAMGYTDEYGYTEKSEYSKIYPLSTSQLSKVTALFDESFFIDGTLLPADQDPHDVSIMLTWYGHIMFYDENGRNNFNHFMSSLTFSDLLREQMEDFAPTFSYAEFRDAAAAPVIEEIISLVGRQ